jgi:hypothetical protein
MLTRILTWLGYSRRATPTHCRCGAPAAVIDPEQPWRGYCGGCYLAKLQADRS